MEDFDRQYGEVSVRTVNRQQMRDYTIHRMTLTDRRVSYKCSSGLFHANNIAYAHTIVLKSGAKREVMQYQLTAWTEDDLWSSPPSLLEAIHHIKAAQRKSPNKPIVVHGRYNHHVDPVIPPEITSLNLQLAESMCVCVCVCVCA